MSDGWHFEAVDVCVNCGKHMSAHERVTMECPVDVQKRDAIRKAIERAQTREAICVTFKGHRFGFCVNCGASFDEHR